MDTLYGDTFRSFVGTIGHIGQYVVMNPPPVCVSDLISPKVTGDEKKVTYVGETKEKVTINPEIRPGADWITGLCLLHERSVDIIELRGLPVLGARCPVLSEIGPAGLAIPELFRSGGPADPNLYPGIGRNIRMSGELAVDQTFAITPKAVLRFLGDVHENICRGNRRRGRRVTRGHDLRRLEYDSRYTD